MWLFWMPQEELPPPPFPTSSAEPLPKPYHLLASLPFLKSSSPPFSLSHPSLLAVGAAAWAMRVPQPAVPPRQPRQSASSLSASRRLPGALATFPRPSPTPCSWPGPWQSPYDLGPPCAGCPLLMAGPGSGPGGSTRPAPHTRWSAGTCGLSLPLHTLRKTQCIPSPPQWGPGGGRLSSDPRLGGLHSPCLSVYPPIKYIWSLWTKRSVSAQSHPPTLDHRPSGLSFLVLLWGTHYRITP